MADMNATKWYRVAALTAILLLAAVLGFWAYPYVKGYVQYPFYVVKCSFQYPVAGVEREGVKEYFLPEGGDYKVNANTVYFCTETQAQEAGYAKVDTAAPIRQ